MRAQAAAALLLASAALAGEIPPVPRGFLVDLAGVVPAADAVRIEARLAAIERRTGHQVAVALLRSLDGEPLEDFTIRTVEQWKVGRKGLDDGLVFFAFTEERKMRLEVGYGLEGTIPDAIARRLLDQAVRPAFRTGDYAGGILALADALDRLFAGEPPPEERQDRRNGRAVPILALIVALLVLQSLSRRRPGRGGFWFPGGFGGGMGGGGFGGSTGGGGFGGFGGGSFGGGGSSGSW